MVSLAARDLITKETEHALGSDAVTGEELEKIDAVRDAIYSAAYYDSEMQKWTRIDAYR